VADSDDDDNNSNHGEGPGGPQGGVANPNDNNNNSNHREIDGISIPEITDTIITDSTIIHDLNNIVIENLIYGQPDINIPLIALRIGVIFLIGLIIEVCNA
jgi:hypothetical protein